MAELSVISDGVLLMWHHCDACEILQIMTLCVALDDPRVLLLQKKDNIIYVYMYKVIINVPWSQNIDFAKIAVIDFKARVGLMNNTPNSMSW